MMSTASPPPPPPPQYLRDIPAGMTHVPSGFLKLDQALGGGFPVGGVTGMGALTGQEKTIFACQVALDASKRGCNVVLVSNHESREDIFLRILANFTSIRYEEFIDNYAALMALPAMKVAYKVLWRLVDARLKILELPWFHGWTIVEHLHQVIEQNTTADWRPHLLIFDDIRRGVKRAVSSQHLRGGLVTATRQAADHLATLADRYRLALVVTAPLSQHKVNHYTRHITPDMLSECTTMAHRWSAFIGVTAQTIRHSLTVLDSRQFFHLTRMEKPQELISIPVIRQFKFQRYLEDDEPSMPARRPGNRNNRQYLHDSLLPPTTSSQPTQ